MAYATLVQGRPGAWPGKSRTQSSRAGWKRLFPKQKRYMDVFASLHGERIDDPKHQKLNWYLATTIIVIFALAFLLVIYGRQADIEMEIYESYSTKYIEFTNSCNYTANDGNEFLVVNISISNKAWFGPSEQPDVYHMYLETNQNIYRVDDLHFEIYDTEYETGLIEPGDMLSPGDTLYGSLVYSIPKDEEPVAIIFSYDETVVDYEIRKEF